MSATLPTVPRAEAEERARHLELVADSEQGPPPPHVNVPAAVEIRAPMHFEFPEGVRMVAPPLPYTAGQVLQGLAVRLELIREQPQTEETLREFLAILEGAAAVFYENSAPVKPVARLLYRLLPNPFLRMSEGDFAWLMDFFWLCRTKRSAGVDAAAPVSLARRMLTSSGT